MATAPGGIPSYVLYGEGGGENPVDFGHIETIAERSSLHDWEIAPHRHRHGVQVLIVSEGRIDLSLDGVSARAPGPAYVVVPAGVVHGFRFAPGTCGHVLTLGQEFARRAEGAADPLGRLLARGGYGALPPEAARRAALLAGELLALGAEPGGGRCFHALAEALLRALPPSAEPGDSEEDRRLARFRHLVETHLAEHRAVSFYARAIGTTERTLSRLCRRRLGCTPLELINGRIALEARRLLRYSNASVAQIADELGFSDPSYFSRFYQRMTGTRPSRDQG